MTRRLLVLAATLGGLLLCTAAASASPLHWTPRRQEDFIGSPRLGSIACPGQCLAVDAAGRVVQFDPLPQDNETGSTAVPIALDSPAPPEAIACPGGYCTVLLADGEETTAGEGGLYGRFTYHRVDSALAGTATATTTATATATGDEALPALACPSRTQCVIADRAGGVVSFSPEDPSDATRTVLSGAGGTALVGVACPSQTQCTAVSATEEWTFDPSDPAAATSVAIDAAPGAATAIACPSTTQCTTVDGSGRETTFDPQAPGTPAPVAVSTNPHADDTALVCPTSGLCVAADQDGLLESFVPQTGGLVASVGATDVDDLACISASSCIADQSTGQVVPFAPDDLAQAATDGFGVDSGTSIVGVQCPSADRCDAVDAGHMIPFDPSPTSDFGGIHAFPGAARIPVTGFACSSLDHCSAVRGNEQVSFNPYHFIHLKPRVADHDGSATFTAVRCPANDECVAVDSNGAAVTYDPENGHIRQGRIDVERGRPLPALACPNTAQCTATDDDGRAISFDPLTGHRLRDLRIDGRVGIDRPSDPTGHEIDGVTCHSTSDCIAVDTLGDVVTFDPRTGHGTRLHRVESQTPLTALSCPTGGFCVLAAGNGRVYTGRPGGTRWTEIHLNEATALTAVSCVSDTECVATDTAGDEYRSH